MFLLNKVPRAVIHLSGNTNSFENRFVQERISSIHLADQEKSLDDAYPGSLFRL